MLGGWEAWAIMVMSNPFLGTCLIGCCAFASLGNAATSCASVAANLYIENATIFSVSHHAQGDVIALPGTVDSCGGESSLANATTDLCRIVLEVNTTSTSSVHLEAWLPDGWNQRFLATGTGGIGGCIDYGAVQMGASLGFATLGTNAGHNGSIGDLLFLNKPEVLNDFGYRAIHVEAVVGKELAQQYYGTAPSKNYYAGCSTGGRQGFSTAMIYPDDFDGVLNGSPGIDWLHIVASKGILARRIGWPNLNSSAYVRPEQWKAIQAEQIKKFDPLDGVTDGIIDDPTQFRFDPMSLACGTGVLNDSFCLNAEQVTSVTAAYQPLANGAGEIVYPSFELGSDTSVFSANQVNGTAQLSYTILQVFVALWVDHEYEVLILLLEFLAWSCVQQYELVRSQFQCQ